MTVTSIREIAGGTLTLVAVYWTGSPFGERRLSGYSGYITFAVAFLCIPWGWSVIAFALIAKALLERQRALAGLMVLVYLVVRALIMGSHVSGMRGVPVFELQGLLAPWQKLGQTLCVGSALGCVFVGDREHGDEDSLFLLTVTCAFWVLEFMVSRSTSVHPTLPLFGGLVGHQLFASFSTRRSAFESNQPSQRWWLMWLCVAVAFLVVFTQDAWYLHYAGAISLDEGYVAAFARAMIHGHWLPYVDAVSHRGPMLYYVTALVESMFGADSWVGIRVLSLFTHVICLAALVSIPLQRGRFLSAAVAGLIFVAVIGLAMPYSDSMSLSGESLGVTFALISVATLMRACHSSPSSRGSIVVSGIFAAFSVLTKQTLLLTVIPLVALTSYASTGCESKPLAPRIRLPRRLTVAVNLLWLSSFAIPLIAVLVIYAIQGRLPSFWYWFVRYNREVYMAPYAGLSVDKIVSVWYAEEQDAYLELVVIILCLCFAVVCLGCSAVRWYTKRAKDFEQALQMAFAAIIVLSLIGAVGPLRFWWHYFITVVPWFALLFGLTLESYFDRIGARVYWLSVLPLACFCVIGGATRLTQLEQQRREGVWEPASSDPICSVVQAHSSSKDLILVWGFDGDVYISCDRTPATKYVYSTLVMGVVPPFWYKRADQWAAEGARADAAAEVANLKPMIVLENRDRFHGMTITSVPALGARIRTDYCAPFVVQGFSRRTWYVYLRKDRGCSSSEAPRASSVHESPFIHSLEE